MRVMKTASLIAATIVLAALVAQGEVELPAVYERALGPREWSFPRDHGRHDGLKTEWWYFTGNLRDPAGHRFGYQLTFFRTALTPHATSRPSGWAMSDLYLAHAAVSDVDGGTFAFKDRLQRGRPGLAQSSEQGLDVSLLDWSAKMGEKDSIRLRAGEADFAIDLTCAGGRGPVLQGPGGVNAKAREPGRASYYYSVTRLRTAGKLTIAGRAFDVEGLSWMDHEFSSDSLAANQGGWDWMGLHLADGSDLMIYRMRDRSGGTDYLSGTHITPDGQPHYLPATDIAIAGARPWKSPKTGGSYPQEWKVKCAGLPELTVTSAMPGQELVTPETTGVDYFEGAARVTDDKGKPFGEGYLELTGYAKPL